MDFLLLDNKFLIILGLNKRKILPEYKLRKILVEQAEANSKKNRKRKFINLKLIINSDDIAYLEFSATGKLSIFARIKYFSCISKANFYILWLLMDILGKRQGMELITFSSKQAFPGTIEYQGIMPIE